MNNKKGQLLITSTVLIIGLIIFFLIVGGSLIAIFNNLPLLIGGALIILPLIAIGRSYVKRGKVERNAGIFFAVLILAGVILVFTQAVSQTVFSVDEIKTSVDGGKVYWTVFASANNINERYDFVKKFEPYEFNDGTTVTPQKSMAILITEQSSSCEYSLIDLGNNIKGLSIPSKNIDLLVLDGNTAQREILEGEKADQVTIQDPDGNGKLVVSSEGLLGGENECPDYENVAIIERDGELTPVYKDILLTERTACQTKFFSYACIQSLFTEIPVNTQFTSSFDSIDISSSKLVGRGLDLGTATFTIRADQDYFDSVIFTPAKDVRPEITSINLPTEIKQDSSSSLRVNIKNNENSEGKVTVSVSSNDDLSFSPNSKELTLKDTTTTTFTVSNGNDLGNKRIKAEVCFIGFSEKICDTEETLFSSIKSSVEPTTFCGDGTCQSSESYTTCPEDCEPGEEPLTCDKWYQELKTVNEVDRTWYNYIGIGEPEVITSEQCKTADYIYIIVVSVIVLILGLAVILTRPKGGKR